MRTLHSSVIAGLFAAASVCAAPTAFASAPEHVVSIEGPRDLRPVAPLEPRAEQGPRRDTLARLERLSDPLTFSFRPWSPPRGDLDPAHLFPLQ